MKLSKTQKILLGVGVVGAGVFAYSKLKGGDNSQQSLPDDPRLTDPETRQNYLTLKNAYQKNIPHTVVNDKGKKQTIGIGTRDWIDREAAKRGITVEQQLIRRAQWQGGGNRDRLITLGNLNIADKLIA